MERNIWKKSKFIYPSAVPTMISPEEKLYLYWLGKSAWSGYGAVVEIGPWLGGSTVCLAAGMQASGQTARKRLHTFDNFIWREFMAVRASLPIHPGDSFKAFFLRNISDYCEIIESHARVLPDEFIPYDHEACGKRYHEANQVRIFEGLYEEPVEILFIDGAKSWRGMLHLLKTLRGNLIPGKSLLVCQDYKYWGTYWVPIMMTRLENYLEPEHNVLSGTTVTFRLISQIPFQKLHSLEDDVALMNTEQALLELNKASFILAQSGDKAGAANVLLGKVSFLCHQHKIEHAVKEFKRIQNSWNLLHPMHQLDRAREYLCTEKFLELHRPKAHEFVLLVKKGWQKIKKKIAENIIK